LKALTRQALQGKCWHNMAVMSMHHYQQAHARAKSTCRVEGASNIEFQCGAHSGQHDGRTLHQAVVCGYDF